MMPVGAVLGRLYQVEYAMEAIGHAGTCLGILASDGIVLAAEKRNTNKLLDELSYSEKIYRLHELVVFVFTELTLTSLCFYLAAHRHSHYQLLSILLSLAFTNAVSELNFLHDSATLCGIIQICDVIITMIY